MPWLCHDLLDTLWCWILCLIWRFNKLYLLSTRFLCRLNFIYIMQGLSNWQLLSLWISHIYSMFYRILFKLYWSIWVQFVTSWNLCWYLRSLDVYFLSYWILLSFYWHELTIYMQRGLILNQWKIWLLSELSSRLISKLTRITYLYKLCSRLQMWNCFN